MPDYFGSTRSNYFRVANPEFFEEWCAHLDLTVWSKVRDEETFYAISADPNAEGWPTRREVKDGRERPLDFHGELAEQLDPRDAAIIMEVGYEGLNYFVGTATAIHPDGRTHTIAIADIYERARTVFGPDINITNAIL